MTENRISIEFATRIYIVVLSLSVLWCLFIVLAPFLLSLGGVYEDISDFLYWFYSPVCHQDDIRSLHLFGETLAVCSRCSTLYFAFLIGTIIYPYVKKISDVNLPSVWFLLVASALMLIDALSDITGIYINTHITRSITGFILGFVLVFYIVPGFINFSHEIFTFLKFNRIQKQSIKNQQVDR